MEKLNFESHKVFFQKVMRATSDEMMTTRNLMEEYFGLLKLSYPNYTDEQKKEMEKVISHGTYLIEESLDFFRCYLEHYWKEIKEISEDSTGVAHEQT